ncbi:MAG TPA: glycosyltransferase [Gemmatimonadales bacterium]|nr:glycosyltransferase [Gemmatimonadales bacterium]
MNGRRLDIGIIGFGNPCIAQALASLQRTCVTDYRIIVVVNPHPDPSRHEQCLKAIGSVANDRVSVTVMPENRGYAGGVSEFLRLSTTEYMAYADHDTVWNTPGWDEQMCALLDRRHEIGMLFPNGGAAMIPRGEYTEILWGVGCAWMLTRLAYADVGAFDTTIGHQEEVDYQTRVRLAGYLIASVPTISVAHEGTASSNPANLERINRGVRAWVDKWAAYFGGKDVNYHSPNVIRHTDWNVHALHMEKYFQQHLPGLNAAPQEVTIEGVEYDLIKVPRLKGFYRNRII